MRLEATIALFAEEPATIPKDTGRWRRFKGLFDKRVEPPPSSGLQTQLLVDGARLALGRVGVNNAVSLEIDGQVLFEDRAHQGDDLGELFGSFDAHEASTRRARFLPRGDDASRARELELVVEHLEGATHVEIRLANRVDAAAGAPDAEVAIVGHPIELERLPEEDVRAQRARIDRLMASPGFVETRRLEFEALVERIRVALAEALPGVRVTMTATEVSIRDVAPGKSRRPKEPARAAAAPIDERLDEPEWEAESFGEGAEWSADGA